MAFPGTPLRPIQAQHRSIHPGQGVQPEKSQDDTSVGQIDQRSAVVRQIAEEGQTDGASDQEQACVQGVRVQSGRGISRVSKYVLFFMVQIFSVVLRELHRSFVGKIQLETM